MTGGWGRSLWHSPRTPFDLTAGVRTILLRGKRMIPFDVIIGIRITARRRRRV